MGGWHAGLALHFFDRALSNRRTGESPVVGQLQRQRVRAKAAGLKPGADPQPRVINAQTEKAQLPLARQRGTGQRLVQPLRRGTALLRGHGVQQRQGQRPLAATARSQGFKHKNGLNGIYSKRKQLLIKYYPLKPQASAVQHLQYARAHLGGAGC